MKLWGILGPSKSSKPTTEVTPSTPFNSSIIASTLYASKSSLTKIMLVDIMLYSDFNLLLATIEGKSFGSDSSRL